MALVTELFGSLEGQMSIAVFAIIVGMAVFFIRMFLKKMNNNE